MQKLVLAADKFLPQPLKPDYLNTEEMRGMMKKLVQPPQESARPTPPTPQADIPARAEDLTGFVALDKNGNPIEKEKPILQPAMTPLGADVLKSQNPGTPTSIKNAQVDIERTQRGLPPVIKNRSSRCSARHGTKRWQKLTARPNPKTS